MKENEYMLNENMMIT